jgi:hypothetical protein
MAWVMATTSDSTLFDPEQALRLAQAEVQLSGGTSPRALEVLAAALAVAGRWDEARQASWEAERLARSVGLASLADQITARRPEYLPGDGSDGP